MHQTDAQNFVTNLMQEEEAVGQVTSVASFSRKPAEMPEELHNVEEEEEELGEEERLALDEYGEYDEEEEGEGGDDDDDDDDDDEDVFAARGKGRKKSSTSSKASKGAKRKVASRGGR